MPASCRLCCGRSPGGGRGLFMQAPLFCIGCQQCSNDALSQQKPVTGTCAMRRYVCVVRVRSCTYAGLTGTVTQRFLCAASLALRADAGCCFKHENMAVCVLSRSACAVPILRTCGHCGLSCPFCCVVLLATNVYARVCPRRVKACGCLRDGGGVAAR